MMNLYLTQDYQQQLTDSVATLKKIAVQRQAIKEDSTRLQAANVKYLEVVERITAAMHKRKAINL